MWKRASMNIVMGLLYNVVAMSASSCFSQQSNAECGCGATPMCGEVCQSSCGCCGCYGDFCTSVGIMSCRGYGCYDILPCSSEDSCFLKEDGAGACAETIGDCDGVRQAYDMELAALRITTVRSGDSPLASGSYDPPCIPSDCEVVDGHCSEGLDTCWFIGNPSSELERLASLYARLGCAQTTECNCPDPPTSVSWGRPGTVLRS